jgi:hypothetical protein
VSNRSLTQAHTISLVTLAEVVDATSANRRSDCRLSEACRKKEQVESRGDSRSIRTTIVSSHCPRIALDPGPSRRKTCSGIQITNLMRLASQSDSFKRMIGAERGPTLGSRILIEVQLEAADVLRLPKQHRLGSDPFLHPRICVYGFCIHSALVVQPIQESSRATVRSTNAVNLPAASSSSDSVGTSIEPSGGKRVANLCTPKSGRRAA